MLRSRLLNTLASFSETLIYRCALRTSCLYSLRATSCNAMFSLVADITSLMAASSR